MSTQEKNDWLFESIKSFCIKANEMTKKGYILLRKDGGTFPNKYFVFKSPSTGKEGIYLEIEKDYHFVYLIKDTITISTNKTVYAEYKQAKKYLSELRFVKYSDGKEFFS